MRCMERNKVLFHYCLFDKVEPLLDAQGHRTTEKRIIYKEAEPYRANISSAMGDAQEEMFGKDTPYDKVIVIEDPACPMDENTVLFVDKAPEYDEDGQPLYDYQVEKVARSLNSVSYAISKRPVS